MINHPTDLDAWQRWQRSHGIERVARRARARLRPAAAPPAPVLLTRGADWSLLAIADAASPTIARAVIDPATNLDDVAILCASDAAALIPDGWHAQPVAAAEVAGIARRAQALLSIGHHVPLSAAVFDAAPRAVRYVVQHGLLTPFAPPLPRECTLLAWSEDDAEFWKSERADIQSQVVGSQLLWNVADRDSTVDPDATPVFLGQLHGAELPRSVLARTARKFCAATGATYRPHPAERDRLSRAQHEWWRRRGVNVDAGGSPLSEVRAPVVSVFSTGVLEAAASGMASWVVCDAPPIWLRDFWQRYGMRQWGGAPTPAPQRPGREPAQVIAEMLR